jgi:hypothetical protein
LSIGFFFAFMMFGSDAYRGSVRRVSESRAAGQLKNTVQAEVRRDDERERAADGLEPAVDLARDGRALPVGRELELARERRLRPAEQAREHLARDARVVVDRLLAHDDEPDLLARGLLLLEDRAQRLGDAERLRRRRVRGELDVHAAVGAHRERGAQRLRGLGGPDRHGLDGGDLLLETLAQPNGLFDGWEEVRREASGRGHHHEPISSKGFYKTL